jgi:hypothetical protein
MEPPVLGEHLGDPGWEKNGLRDVTAHTGEPNS